MKINLQSPIEEVQIPIVPLIDVIFCILTFFLLAALQFTSQQSISVDLPKASTGTASQVPQRLLVTIGADSQIYVEQQPVRMEQLAEALKSYFQSNPNGTMVLNASRSSSYDSVVQVLDEMRKVGGDRVSLATLPSSSNQPAPYSSVTTPSFPLAPGSAPTAPPNSLLIPSPVPTATSQLPSPYITPGQSFNGQGTSPQIPTAPNLQPSIFPSAPNSSP